MIRHALTAVALIALLAAAQHAAASLVARNQSGGAIALTDTVEPCPAPYRVAVATAEPDRRTTGCWIFDEPTRLIWIMWPHRQPMSYEPSHFESRTAL